eukprot:CAMPEP_0117020002 /NCGR_PEP_ID=MMETSP0472-20121206/15260_1 /TAXON_ID=693140 ORGANISM="Tiarina fusus, Strain LIS" /NCGR_SAMPLE_ID=MMETSP0472 /ASSEMBLY_ACC=CAM_ASM_000603 /LENGTH=400 /DNA_ID=CAMNT_0004725091 /DNA_START=152 /DNA_END=1354 /DNA_ORIENTATION=-
MRKFDVAVPNGDAASSVEEAEKVAKKIGSDDFVLKAQILAGGRGKGTFVDGFKGGVHTATSVEEAKGIAYEMLGNRLITKQTGPSGQLVNKILVAHRHYIRREAYFAILLDRKTSNVVMVASRFGGMDIETVAEENPHAIIKVAVKISEGVSDEQCQQLTKAMGFPSSSTDQVTTQIKNLYTMFTRTDATQIEINPLVETSEGQIMCLDAKVNFDDNAAFRQKEIFSMRDYSQEDEREVKASKYDLNYIGLDGTIGCLVNGAGLAMATMDIIKLEGGAPANFLDVGGGATDKQVTEALKIIASDPHVKAILVNIFGGIMRCDVIALGILNAVQTLNLRIPIVVRLSGTNVKQAYKIIDDSALKVIPATDLADAAEKVVKVANIMEMAQKAELNVSFELPL